MGTKLSHEERVLRARMAAHSMHAQGKTNTGPATKAAMERFEREVDPDGVLPEAERRKRAKHAKSRYYTELALKRHQKAKAARAG